MELKPLNETIGWIWPKQIISPALTLDFELGKPCTNSAFVFKMVVKD
jgi:hypothetical protein